MNLNINTAYGILSIFLWSTTVAIVRSITCKINAIQAGAATFSIGGIVCISLLAVNNHLKLFRHHSFKYLSICGLLFVIYMVALFVAIERAEDNQQAMELGLINYLWPSLTVVLSLFLLSNSASLLVVPGILISFLGIFVVVSQQASFSWKSFTRNIKSNLVAYCSALIAALTWAIYSNLTNLWANPDAVSAVFLFIPFTGLVFLLLSKFSMKHTQPIQTWERRTLIEIFYFSISTVLAYIFWDISMRRSNVTHVAILSYFTPFFSAVILCLYHKERLSKKLWLGCFLIIIGSLISWISIYKI